MTSSSSFPQSKKGNPSSICCRPCGGAVVLTGANCPVPTTNTRPLGNSVLLSSGQFAFNLPLLSISSLGGVGWSFGLNYLSDMPVDGAVGMGFDFPQNLRLEEGSGYVVLLPGDFTEERFDEVSAGVYEAAEDNNTQATLTLSGSGINEEFVMRSSQGTVTRFYGFDLAIDTPGRLKSITDRYGNVQTYTWTNVSGVDQLLSLTDSYGRTVEYRYYGDEQGHRLREIEDFLGRKLNFQYDNDGHLLAVVTPSITRGAEGNTFPGGTAYVFQYDTENPLPERQHDLIRIWYPNQTLPYLNVETRTVDVEEVYANAAPRYFVEYGQDDMQLDWGKVVAETVGDPGENIGGTYTFAYSDTSLTTSIFPDAQNEIVFRATVTDRNGNERVYEFNAARMPVRVEVKRNRNKISIPSTGTFPSYITWTQYNVHNQPVLTILPEGNSIENTYSNGTVTGISGTYNRRVGLLEKTTRRPGNDYSIPSRAGSGGQTELTQRFFYDPIFNQQCAVIEARGNPIASGSTYFTPQNGGSTPTNSDRSRYATFTYFDYQKNTSATITGSAELQALLNLDATQIGNLITFVDNQMKATNGAGGLPVGFPVNLGDINGDGTGNGASSGLPASPMLGNVIRIKHPSVRMIDAIVWEQKREEIFTVNTRGQQTTHTDPEGNVSVFLRYPFSDPEGDGQFVAGQLSNKQYGRMREARVDVDPNDVMSLVGDGGDLVDFQLKIYRENAPGVYQNLITRYEGTTLGAGAGCSSCAYDPLGNPLAQTDARGFTTHFDRNELGEIYRTTSADPYRYRAETHYDANRNVVRVDTEDKFVDYASLNPKSPLYAHFNPSVSDATAQVPTRAGNGGLIRPGWFTDLMSFDLLDNLIESNSDATGSEPERLITRYEYDPNQNTVRVIKPEGNTVETDYDERDLPIAVRAGNAPDTPAVSVTAYDANGNVLQVVGPAQRGDSGNWQTVTIQDAFDSGSPLVHTGDFSLQNVYDGFDRAIEAIDAAGNVAETVYDPGGRAIEATAYGPVGGATPTDRSGTDNVLLAESFARYDEGGRPYEAQNTVLVGNTSSDGPLPSGREITHTGGGLAPNSTANNHTNTVTIYNPAGANETSYVLGRTIYGRSGRTEKTIADNTAETLHIYDGANRRIKTTDALGNVLQMEYDGNSNLVHTTSIEKCTIEEPAEIEDEVFRTAMFYDALGRLVLTARQGADGSFDAQIDPCACGLDWTNDRETIISLIGYDSRSNATLSIDPKGNTVITTYDGASRPTQVQEHARKDGQGTAGPEGENQTFLPYGGATVRSVTTRYDGNSRVKELLDDNSNVTRYEYDTLDRRVTRIYPNGSASDSVYNTASNLVQFTDENGSVFENTFDALGRKVLVEITRATDVIGTTEQAFKYDGLSRPANGVDAISSDEAEVALFHDSLNRILEDSQAYDGNTRNVTNNEFVSYSVSQFTFPNGRLLDNSYDALYRRVAAIEASTSTPIASWQFFGPNRIAEVKLAAGCCGTNLYCSFMNNARNHSAVQSSVSNPDWGNQSSDRLGYDGAGRPIAKRYLLSGIQAGTGAYTSTMAVTGQTTEYDKASNKFFERALHVESRSSLYEPRNLNGIATGGYDSLDRLRQYQRGVLATGGGSIITPIGLPNTNESARYELDGLGNWTFAKR